MNFKRTCTGITPSKQKVNGIIYWREYNLTWRRKLAIHEIRNFIRRIATHRQVVQSVPHPGTTNNGGTLHYITGERRKRTSCCRRLAVVRRHVTVAGGLPRRSGTPGLLPVVRRAVQRGRGQKLLLLLVGPHITAGGGQGYEGVLPGARLMEVGVGVVASVGAHRYEGRGVEAGRQLLDQPWTSDHGTQSWDCRTYPVPKKTP